MGHGGKRPDILEYTDYRLFLRDLYSHFKESVHGFSYRAFSKRAGFASPNFLKLVIEGKRNLSSESVVKFQKALTLMRAEAQIFETLVEFNQAESADKKNTHFQKLKRIRRYREIEPLRSEQFEYYSHWYHIAIRELAHSDRFKEDPAWISKTLRPKISEAQAKSGLVLLQKLGLLVRDSKNRLKPGNPTLKTDAEVHSLYVLNFHKAMIARAEESLDTVASELRDVSSATVSLHEEDLPAIKSRVAQFRKDLIATFDRTEGTADCVYQMNFQIFPLTNKVGEE